MQNTPRPRRSVLYMPGSNARALEKAKTLAADCLILDLEDAVAPDQKALAREQVRTAVKTGGYGAREIIIRINALESEWGSEDLMVALAARPNAVLVPKVSTPDDVRVVARSLSASDIETVAIWAMVETPAAILNIAAIAATADEDEVPLQAFVMGTNDLAKETDALWRPGRAAFATWLSQTVIAARAYGLAAIDGVFADIQDTEGFAVECQQGRDFGMDGKTLIHPGQIETANQVFAPNEHDVAWARDIIAAFDDPANAGKGAIALNGRMVELLHAGMARRTVAIAESIQALEEA